MALTPEEKLAKRQRRTEAMQLFTVRLRECAEAVGLSQTDIAARLHVKGPKVGNWFQGLNYPKRDALRLAEMLGVPVSYLLRGTLTPPRWPMSASAKPTPIPGSAESKLASIITDIAGSNPPPTIISVPASQPPTPINRVALLQQLDKLIDSLASIPEAQLQFHIIIPPLG